MHVCDYSQAANAKRNRLIMVQGDILCVCGKSENLMGVLFKDVSSSPYTRLTAYRCFASEMCGF